MPERWMRRPQLVNGRHNDDSVAAEPTTSWAPRRCRCPRHRHLQREQCGTGNVRILSSGAIKLRVFWPGSVLFPRRRRPRTRTRVARPAVTDVAGAAARLAGVHGRLAAAHGNITAAQSAFERGLAEIERLPLSYERALLELAYGQVLRRAGQRRAAASQLQAARDRLSTLNARPDLERCDRELAACGLDPRQTQRIRPQPAHRTGIGGRRVGRHRHEQPRSRHRTIRQHQNRPIPPHPHLRQTRHQLPLRTRRTIPRPRHQ